MTSNWRVKRRRVTYSMLLAISWATAKAVLAWGAAPPPAPWAARARTSGRRGRSIEGDCSLETGMAP